MQLVDKSLRRIRRALYRHSISYPFLTGDLFASKADVSVFANVKPKNNPSKKEVSDARVIYCKSNRVEEFFSEYRGSINASVLLFGNSAENFDSFDHPLPNSVKMVFLQNLSFHDRRFSCLPVGIENKKNGNYGVPKLFDSKYSELPKINEVLIGPFGDTHIERSTFKNFETEVGPWTYLDKRLSSDSFAKISSRYRFIASPRGTGIDTHRFWEAIYRGVIPIVKRNKWSESLAYLDIPFIEVDEWNSECLRVICGSDIPLSINPKSIEDIWWPNWGKRIRAYL